MSKKRLIKFVVIIAAIAISAVALIEGFALFAPNTLPIESFFGNESKLEMEEEKYHAYMDSLEILDFKIRNESDSKLILIYRKVQENYRSKLDDIRTKLDGKEVVHDQIVNSEPTVESLSSTILTALAIPIGVLLVLIVLVIYLIKKKKPEPILPFESKPSVAKRFDDAIEKANIRQEPRDSISTMLKTLNQTLEEKRALGEEIGSAPRGILKERKERPRVYSEDNAFRNTQEIETIKAPEPEGVRQKETDSGKIEIITPDAPISAPILDDTLDESGAKEAKINTDVIKLARRGYTSSEIARRLRISQDQVDLIIRMQREE